MKNKIIMYLTALIVFIGDLLIKHLCSGQNHVLIDRVLAIRSCENTGISFGLFQNGGPFIIGMTLLILCGMVIYAHIRLQGNYYHFLFGLIIGGALGNLYDRIVLGYVRDMFQFLFVEFSVFNIADSAVVCGALLLIIHILFGKEKNIDHA